MKRIKFLAMFVVALTAVSLSTYAQNSHDHSPKHGGIVQEAGGYHIEMVSGKDKSTFYLFDGNQKSVAKSVTGSASFEFGDKAKTSSKLKKLANGGFEVATPQGKMIVACTVTFMVGTKQVTSRYKNPSVTPADAEHGHQH